MWLRFSGVFESRYNLLKAATLIWNPFEGELVDEMKYTMTDNVNLGMEYSSINLKTLSYYTKFILLVLMIIWEFVIEKCSDLSCTFLII